MQRARRFTWSRFITVSGGVLVGIYVLVAMTGILALSPCVPYAAHGVSTRTC